MPRRRFGSRSLARLLVLPLLALAGLAFIQAGFAQPAAAQAWPTKPVRFIVPFAPGGTTDILARILAERLSESLGQQFVVENRAGAGGNIGADLAAKAPADGYTILMSTPGPSAINQYIYSKMPYDTAKDLAPVALVATIPNVMVVHPAVPAKTVQEFVALAKAKPDSLNYGTPGPGSTAHLSTELFKTMTGTKLVHIPYKGSNPALMDLIGGQVQIMIDNLPSAIQFIRAGQLRALAVSSAQRSPALPDVPTIGESVPGYEASSWFCVVVPAGTPREVVAKLNAEINKALSLPQVKERFDALGATPGGGSPEDLGTFIAAEMVKWKKVAEISGAKLD